VPISQLVNAVLNEKQIRANHFARAKRCIEPALH